MSREDVLKNIVSRETKMFFLRMSYKMCPLTPCLVPKYTNLQDLESSLILLPLNLQAYTRHPKVFMIDIQEQY